MDQKISLFVYGIRHNTKVLYFSLCNCRIVFQLNVKFLFLFCGVLPLIVAWLCLFAGEFG